MIYKRESEESEYSNWRTGSTTRRIDRYIPDRAMVPTPASPPGLEDPTEIKYINNKCSVSHKLNFKKGPHLPHELLINIH